MSYFLTFYHEHQKQPILHIVIKINARRLNIVRIIKYISTFCIFIAAVEMLRFYSWLKQILKKMDNNLNWEEIKSIMGEWIRKKLSGKPIIVLLFILM